MASAKENVPLAPPQLLLRQTSSPRPPTPTPLWPKMANGATEPPVSGGVKCTCFRLPSRTKKPHPPHPAPKLRSASSRSAVAPDVSAATASQSQRVTFRASAPLSTRWPSSPSATSASAAGATATPAPAGSGGSVVAPRRASSSSSVAPTTMKAGAVSTSSSSFSHWRCRSLSSSRVMPHGERASFSFAVSPASASSSCMSTPNIPQGWQQK
ncbi:endochitinase A1-like [Miscanthus floridulus]|uniref:endochitinase A1-like n=1 Tax=Miscanthus floridulus TaxID=154761 RepID=UPI00345AFA44